MCLTGGEFMKKWQKILIPISLFIAAGSVTASFMLIKNDLTGKITVSLTGPETSTPQTPTTDTPQTPSTGDSSTPDIVIDDDLGSSTEEGKDDVIDNTGAITSQIKETVYSKLAQQIFSLYDNVCFSSMSQKDISSVYVDLDTYSITINGKKESDLLSFKTNTDIDAVEKYLDKLNNDTVEFTNDDSDALIESFTNVYSADTYKNYYDMQSSSIVSDTVSYVLADQLGCEENTLDTTVHYTLANVAGSRSDKCLWINAYTAQNTNGDITYCYDTNNWIIPADQIDGDIEQYLIDQANYFVNGEKSIYDDIHLNKTKSNLSINRSHTKTDNEMER